MAKHFLDHAAYSAFCAHHNRNAPLLVSPRRRKMAAMVFGVALLWLHGGSNAFPLFAAPALAAKSEQTQASGSLLPELLKGSLQNLSKETLALIPDADMRNFATWKLMQARPEDFSFEELATFISAHPDWPSLYSLRKHIETQRVQSIAPAQAVTWFSKYPPTTAIGKYNHALAAHKLGIPTLSTRIVKTIWKTATFPKQLEKDFLNKFSSYLTTKDHENRFDAMLWNRHLTSAKRIQGLLGKKFKALAKARLKLIETGQGVDQALRNVPEALRNTPGLIFDRLRWHREKGSDSVATQILNMPIANSIHPEKWWFHRMQLARKYYGQNDFKKAYMLSKNHGLSRGVEFAKSEWFAGWLALRKLNAPKVALAHFQHLHENVSTPVSRSRAAYWAGRASFAIKDYANARKWYTEAAKYGTTFYGQLAHEALGHKKSTILPNDPLPTAADLKWIKSDPLLKIARFIAPSALRQDTRLFLTAAFDKADSPGKMALITRIARELGYADMSVRLSRSAKMKGIALVEAGYPIPKMINKQQPPETALLLALIRQESSFDPDAQSPVGARGLMQLMPATAQAEARKLKLSYTTAKLTDDPQYNMTLGKSYLNGLLQRFDGSYILAIASYNAGPTAVSRWVKEYGSPTDPNVDVVDWIESIPYSETRNYVQRILESTQVYRKRLGATAFKTTLMHDLLR